MWGAHAICFKNSGQLKFRSGIRALQSVKLHHDRLPVDHSSTTFENPIRPAALYRGSAFDKFAQNLLESRALPRVLVIRDCAGLVAQFQPE